MNASLWRLSIAVALLGCGGGKTPVAFQLPMPVARYAAAVKEGERWPIVHYSAALPARAAMTVAGETWLATAGGIVRLARADAPLPQIGVAEGLPAAGVYSLARAADGAILAGTDDGIARIDDGGRARALAEPRGRVTAVAWPYAATWNGVFDLERAQWISETAGLSITDLSHCQQRLYLATNDKGLFVFANRRLRAVSQIGVVHVGRLACSRDGQLWVGAVNGLFVVTGERARATAAWRQHVSALALDGNDVLFGTFGQGAFRLRQQRLERLVDAERISFIHRDGGSLLLGGENRLFRIDSKGTKTISISGPPPGPITALALSDDGVAAGSFDHGLALLSVDGWRAQPLPDPRVTALARDARGELWVGTATGLLRFVDGRLDRLRDPRGWLERHINALRVRGDELWVAAHPGLIAIDLLGEPPSYRYFGARGAEASADLVGGTAYGLAFQEGALWVGTDQGVTRLFAGSAHSMTDLDGVLPENWINDVRADGERLWILTLRSGLVRLWPGGTEVWSCALMTNPSSLLAVDGLVAFGTNSAGLVVSDGRAAQLFSYGPRQGLSSAMVGALVYDGAADRLWIGGSGGIDRIDGLRRRWTSELGGGEP